MKKGKLQKMINDNDADGISCALNFFHFFKIIFFLIFSASKITRKHFKEDTDVFKKKSY